MSLFILFPIIFAASFVLTMVGFGIGSGVFIVPLLIYVLGIPTKTAAATSIFIVVFSSFSGFIAHVSIAVPDW